MRATTPPRPHDPRHVNGVALHHAASAPENAQAQDGARQCPETGGPSPAATPGQSLLPAAVLANPLPEQQHAARTVQGSQDAQPAAAGSGRRGGLEAVRFVDTSPRDHQPALLGQSRMRSRSVKDAARVSPACGSPGNLLSDCRCGQNGQEDGASEPDYSHLQDIAMLSALRNFEARRTGGEARQLMQSTPVTPTRRSMHGRLLTDWEVGPPSAAVCPNVMLSTCAHRWHPRRPPLHRTGCPGDATSIIGDTLRQCCGGVPHPAQEPGPASAPEPFTDAALRKALVKMDAMQVKQEQRTAACADRHAVAGSQGSPFLQCAQAGILQSPRHSSEEQRRMSPDTGMASPFLAGSMQSMAPPCADPAAAHQELSASAGGWQVGTPFYSAHPRGWTRQRPCIVPDRRCSGLHGSCSRARKHVQRGGCAGPAAALGTPPPPIERAPGAAAGPELRGAARQPFVPRPPCTYLTSEQPSMLLRLERSRRSSSGGDAALSGSAEPHSGVAAILRRTQSAQSGSGSLSQRHSGGLPPCNSWQAALQAPTAGSWPASGGVAADNSCAKGLRGARDERLPVRSCNRSMSAEVAGAAPRCSACCPRLALPGEEASTVYDRSCTACACCLSMPGDCSTAQHACFQAPHRGMCLHCPRPVMRGACLERQAHT